MKTDFCEYCGSPLNGSEKLVTVYRHSRRSYASRASINAGRNEPRSQASQQWLLKC